MGLKAVVSADEFGELDEGERAFYNETDDGEQYVLDVEDVDNHPTVRNLANTYQTHKKDRKKALDTLRQVQHRFGPLLDDNEIDLTGVDADRVKELLPVLRGEQDIPTGDGKGGELTEQQREKIRDNERKRYEPKLQQANQERDFWRSTAEDHIINTQLRSEFARAGVKDEDFLDLLVERYRRRCELQVDDGKPTIIVRDTDYGDVDPKEFVKEWANTDYAKKFTDAGGSSGGGALGGGRSQGKTKNPWSPEHWSMTEQARLVKEHPERAKSMAAAYGKKIGR